MNKSHFLRKQEELNTDSDCTFALTIDGPAASGKSVVSGEVARRLRIRFLDTGVMYRAITWAAIQHRIKFADEAQLTNLAESTEIRLVAHSDGDRLLLDGEDITDCLRLAEVDANVSAVSAVSGVRRALVAQQRSIAADGPIVMCGRDIGSVVLPNAAVKIFLTASAEVRAARRVADIHRKQETSPSDYNNMLAALRRRDEIDSNREDSPLRPAQDAAIICSDNKTIEEVVQEVMAMVKQC